MQKPEATSNIPPLLAADGVWAFDNRDKCRVLQEAFQKKWVISFRPSSSDLFSDGYCSDSFVPVRPRIVRRFLALLDADSAAGPDGIPARVLKKMHLILEIPVTKIIRKNLSSGVWPDTWKCHWIFPLVQERSDFEPLSLPRFPSNIITFQNC